MGADGQMDPEKMTDLMDPIVDGRADYTKGNRFLGRTERGDMPLFRFVGNATLGAITKIASGYWNSGDPQSGYTVISKRALERSNIEEMYEFYGYCNDLLVKLNVAGMRVVDVPAPSSTATRRATSSTTLHPEGVRDAGQELPLAAEDKVPRLRLPPAGGRLRRRRDIVARRPPGVPVGAPGVGSFGTPLARGAPQRASSCSACSPSFWRWGWTWRPTRD